jgi:hypothetical protein
MIKKYDVFDVTYDGGGASFPNDLREDERGMYERVRMLPGAKLKSFEAHAKLEAKLEKYEDMIKKYKKIVVAHDGGEVKFTYLHLGVHGREDEKDEYERARTAPGAKLKSFEINPKRDNRLEEYEIMLATYDKFSVDVDSAVAPFPNRGVLLDKPIYDEYRAHPRAELTRAIEISKNKKRKLSPSP